MALCTRPWPVLVLCCILTFCGMGLVFGMGSIFLDIIDVYRVSRATASLVQSVCLGVGFGMGLVVGNFVEWKGPRVTVITGSVVATVGYVIAFLATHIVQVIVGIGVIAGIGISFMFIATQVVTGVVFYDMKGFALAVFSIFTAGGSVFFPLLLRHVTNLYSLRGTFLIMAAINCQMILCGALLGIFIPRSPRKTAVISEPGKEAEDEVDVAGDEESHGNPRRSGDGGEDCRCAVEGIPDEERVRLVAKDQGATGDDGTMESDDNCLANTPEKSSHLDSPPHDSAEADKEERARLISDTEGNIAQNPRNGLASARNSLAGNENLEDARSCDLTPLETTNGSSGDSNRRPVSKLRNTLNNQLKILRNAEFVIFAVFCPSAFLFFTQPMMFMTDMVKSNQMTAEDGSFFLTVMFIGSITGRVAAGVLHKVLKSRTILFVNSAAIAMGGVTCAFYSLTTAYAHFVAVSFIFGLSYGLYSASVTMTFLEILGPDLFPVGMGNAFTVAGAFVLLAGPYGGTVRDLAKSYEPLYYIACAHSIFVGLLLVFTAVRCHRRS